MRKNKLARAFVVGDLLRSPAKGEAAPSIRPSNYAAALRFAGCYLEAHSAGRTRLLKKTIAARCVVRHVY
jgi:hypothetical protein